MRNGGSTQGICSRSQNFYIVGQDEDELLRTGYLVDPVVLVAVGVSWFTGVPSSIVIAAAIFMPMLWLHMLWPVIKGLWDGVSEADDEKRPAASLQKKSDGSTDEDKGSVY